MTVFLLWLQLATLAAIILATSHFLARSADVIALKTGLGRSFVGVVMLATATSMPEMATGVSSILLVGEPDLAAGNALGANIVNLFLIALLDLYWRNGPILNAVSTTSVLVGGLGIAITSTALIAIFVHGATASIAGWYVSPFSVAMVAIFVSSMILIYRHDTNRSDNDGTQPGADHYAEDSLQRAVLTFAVASAFIIGAAIFLSKTGDSLADAMKWETSFVGTQFLAIITTLPEAATSFAAVRLNAPDLALTNLLGSNIFNHGFVLFLDDVVYTKGVFWGAISPVHSLTAGVGVLMTSVVIIALVTRPRRRLGKYWTPEGLALAALYLSTGVLLFRLA